jgi:hypothetical protein
MDNDRGRQGLPAEKCILGQSVSPLSTASKKSCARASDNAIPIAHVTKYVSSRLFWEYPGLSLLNNTQCICHPSGTPQLMAYIQVRTTDDI